ncbi:MAG: metalloprotease PmbA, partial [Gammaproteobacteria bacterium]|nr:metalloprotease PmbA [Gammaproteobacteria bacterium]
MPDIQTSEQESPFPEQSRLEDIVQDLIAQAQQQGADEVEAGVSIDAGLSVTVRLGETETLEYNRDRALGLTVYFDKCKGSASTADFAPESLAATVKAACDIARYTSKDEYAGLADPKLLATTIPDLDLYHPWNITAEQAIELATETEDAARQVDPRIENSEGGTVFTNAGMRVKANTHGFMAGYKSSYHSLSCAVIGKQEEEMQRDFWSWSARDKADLMPAAEVGRIAGERTVRRLGTQSLSTREVPVIYAADIAGSLFGHFINAVSGSSLYRKASFLLDSLGKPVFPDFMRIHEQPLLLKGLGSAPYDGEGVATRSRDIVTDGILQGYVLNSYAA